MKPRTIGLIGLLSLASIAATTTGTVTQNARAERIRLAPVDQAGQEPAFARFRERFVAAVKSRDATFVVAASVPELQKAFRGSLDLPRERWAGPPYEATDWGDLEKIFSVGGGSFTTTRGGERGRREFCAPYTYSEYPNLYPSDLPGSNIETEGHPWVVIGVNVPVRARPAATGRVLTHVSRDLVMQIGQIPGTEPRWYRIGAPDGHFGWIPAAQLRDPADYHACFAQINGAWKLTVLTTGMPPWP